MKGHFYRNYGKRAVDVALAATGLVVASPLLAGIALGILALDGSPAIFRQQRIGRQGQPFTLLKFRTMRHSPSNRSTVTTSTDPRVTRIGALLRRLKLDELPQLWNVLKSDMSFVGPRPDVPGYADRLHGNQRRILELRPGITGPATLAFRREEELLASVEDPQAYNDEVVFPRKVEINLEYLENCSLLGDLGYIVKTVLPWFGESDRLACIAEAKSVESSW